MAFRKMKQNFFLYASPNTIDMGLRTFIREEDEKRERTASSEWVIESEYELQNLIPTLILEAPFDISIHPRSDIWSKKKSKIRDSSNNGCTEETSQQV